MLFMTFLSPFDKNDLQLPPQNTKIPPMRQKVAIIGKKTLFSLLLQKGFKVHALESE